MRLRGLSLDQMPPLGRIIPFFLTGPLFGIFAGILLLTSDAQALGSRWNLTVLAVTHTITLGFMTMSMIGALLQVLPVVAGVNIPWGKHLAYIIYTTLTVGVIGLALGFTTSDSSLILGGGAILTTASLLFFLIPLAARIGALVNTITGRAIALAGISLLITLALGALLALGHLRPEAFPNFRQWTDIHLLWGLSGWLLLLVIGVSYQVVPMFYVSPDYPRRFSSLLPLGLFLTLVSFTLVRPYHISGTALFTLLLILCASFGLITLSRFMQRRRKNRDVSLWFWFTAIGCLLVAIALLLMRLGGLEFGAHKQDVLIGILLIAGFAVTLIIGMLQKIVPFLVWLNLQQTYLKKPGKRMPLSNMHTVITDQCIRRQFILHSLALCGLVAWGVFESQSQMSRLAGLLVIADFSYLAINTFKAYQLYRDLHRELVS